MDYETKIQKLREEYKTAPPSRQFAIELQAKVLKMAIFVRDKKKK